MKRFIYAIITPLALVLFLNACDMPTKKADQKKSDSTSSVETKINSTSLRIKFPLTGVTLTGYTSAQAKALTETRLSDSTSSHSRTSIWFCKDWLKRIVSELDNEHNADGVRIYFAKNPITKYNTVFIVSTKDNGPNPKAPSLRNHIDNFVHTFNFQFPAGCIMEDKGIDPGATLFKKKPGIDKPCALVLSIDNPNAISPDHAYDYVNNFYNGGVLEKINTRCEWFRIEALKFLLADLEAPHSSDAPSDGVRLYFAKIPRPTSQYNRHGFVIVPTVNDIKNKIPREDDFTCHSSPLFEKLREKLRKSFDKKRYPRGDPEENGEECPNNCDGITTP